MEAPEQCDDGAANGDGTSCCTTTCEATAPGTDILACTTTTTTSTTTSTTLPCPDNGFDGVDCLLRSVVPPCIDERMPGCVRRRITAATTLVDHGMDARTAKKARTLARRASKVLKSVVAHASAAAAKGQLSMLCGDALDGVLQEAARRTKQLAASHP
ncbi:MAG: hypothetical protein E6J75_15975 [Deltaproteobacteria bacterium]|nr:MAG: hypothetical protein E6J75_15975 [Deltaproteobacteria bacterium]